MRREVLLFQGRERMDDVLVAAQEQPPNRQYLVF
jgi:hypothetical protein